MDETEFPTSPLQPPTQPTLLSFNKHTAVNQIFFRPRAEILCYYGARPIGDIYRLHNMLQCRP